MEKARKGVTQVGEMLQRAEADGETRIRFTPYPPAPGRLVTRMVVLVLQGKPKSPHAPVKVRQHVLHSAMRNPPWTEVSAPASTPYILRDHPPPNPRLPHHLLLLHPPTCHGRVHCIGICRVLVKARVKAKARESPRPPPIGGVWSRLRQHENF